MWGHPKLPFKKIVIGLFDWPMTTKETFTILNTSETK
jgi:hypothetical protein